ncbi:MAG: superoxide dismutase family protein [Noviherbaspirillum sp.]
MRTLAIFAASACLLAGYAGTAQAQTASVELKPTQGNKASGTAKFTKQGDRIMVEAKVEGLTPGLHGFHIHEKGDCSAPDAASAGGHFNPTKAEHGNPASGAHHGGDLGNLDANTKGVATLNTSVQGQGLSMDKEGANSIVGRSVVVHADPDDFKSQPAGNSGKRIACGVISLK